MNDLNVKMKPIHGDRGETDSMWVDDLFKPGYGCMEGSLYYSVYIACLKFFIIYSLKSEINEILDENMEL